jgi:TIR domain
MALLTKSYLSAKAQKASGYVTEQYIRASAAEKLVTLANTATAFETFDIFLSHSREDAILIRGLRDELTDLGLRVYVDWIEDPQLDRSNVTTETAAQLRSRMRQAKCLLFATSEAAKKSVWMPWELGYMDGHRNSRVAIAPMVEDYQSGGEFKGQEYLGLYPYLDKTGDSLWIHKSSQRYVRFADWLEGKDP